MKNSVGQFIKNRRLALGLTQKEVADYTGVAEATVSRWESAEINNMRRDRIESYPKYYKLILSV